MNRRNARVLARVAAGLVSAALLASCADTVDGKPVDLPTAVSPPTGFPTQTPTPTPTSVTSEPPATPTSPVMPPAVTDSGWRSVRDAATGVRFRMPAAPKKQTTNGTTPDGLAVQSRNYTTIVDGEVDASVAVTSGKNVVFDNLKVLPTDLVTRLQGQGNSKVQILAKSTRKLKGRPALSFRVLYQPLSQADDPPVWFYTAIDDGSALIIVQTVEFPDLGTSKVRLPRDRTIHDLLVKDVTLS